MPLFSRRPLRSLCPWTLLAILGLASCWPSQPAASSPDPSRPRLAVLVYFDQLRGDYIARWRDLFGEGGFRRLEDEGAWFQDCHYPYAFTVTAAGHASVATGCSPEKHGIVGNDWYDRAEGATVNCVGSDRYDRVPPKAAAAGKDGGKDATKNKPRGVSPERLLQPTLADALKAATGGRGRVVALSFKDRAAVLPGGRRPDACYWLDTGAGEFVTSTYYRDAPHPWVAEFNRGHPADRWYGKQWRRLRPDLDYERLSGPDDAAGEGVGIFQGRMFPHPMSGGPLKTKAAYYGALYDSPFGNDLLLGLVERAIDAEQLGTRDVPDLLCVSFSCNDPVGHIWGPDSQEVLDVTLRSDLVVKELLAHLDAAVGKGRYVLVLTADHGVCPLPEVARGQGKDAGRVSPSMLGSRAEDFLNETFGGKDDQARWLEATSSTWVYLNQAMIRHRGLKPADVEAALAGWLTKQDGVQAVYTRTQLEGSLPEGDAFGKAVRRSFYPGRSGDLFVLLKPYHLLSGPLGTGTTHGTPHPYDTHVPLLVYGTGVHPGVRNDRVTPEAASAVLARALGIKPPEGAEAPVPEGLFGPR